MTGNSHQIYTITTTILYKGIGFTEIKKEVVAYNIESDTGKIEFSGSVTGNFNIKTNSDLSNSFVTLFE